MMMASQILYVTVGGLLMGWTQAQLTSTLKLKGPILVFIHLLGIIASSLLAVSLIVKFENALHRHEFHSPQQVMGLIAETFAFGFIFSGSFSLTLVYKVKIRIE